MQYFIHNPPSSCKPLLWPPWVQGDWTPETEVFCMLRIWGSFYWKCYSDTSSKQQIEYFSIWRSVLVLCTWSPCFSTGPLNTHSARNSDSNAKRRSLLAPHQLLCNGIHEGREGEAGMGSNRVTVTKFLQLLMILELYLELSYILS